MTTHPCEVLKYCMRCGSDAVVFRQNKSILCNRCGFCYYMNSASAVALLILNDKGELLLTKRAFEPEKGKLDLPGGFVDTGERAEDTVRRELKEELNIDVCRMHYWGSYPNEYVYSGVTIYTLDIAFVCTVKSFHTIEANDDVADYDFYDLKDINLEDIAFKSIRNIIADFSENKK